MAPTAGETFIVDLDGFEGPLDLLLDLARRQKVDLTKISVLQLADQYLDYLGRAQALELDIAADYLVMAAWLAYLKSQLLLPKAEREEDEAEELADALASRLRTLDAMRRAGDFLMDRPQLGVARFARGMPEPVEVRRGGPFRALLGDLLAAQGRVMGRQKGGRMALVPRRLMSVEEALQRLARALTGHDWRHLESFLPEGLKPGMESRAAIAAAFVAGLELARRGEVEIDQDGPFAPIRLRRVAPAAPAPGR